ncbi:polyprenyl synthetase family protein [Staphylococcus marylandisciuri]
MNPQMNKYISLINDELKQIVPSSFLGTNLEESMQYSLEAGGKRIRPLLTLLTLQTLNKDIHYGMQTALALEMIHTYSLIHDDLPSMDDDDYRRGQLTNHKVFGEWKAILAGDALLTKAFQLISNDHLLATEVRIQIIKRLSEASGHMGMVGGQVLDMESENKEIDLETLQLIHKTKTGALLKFAVMAAVDIAQPNNHIAQSLERFSEHLGLMFQIKDDLLDVYGDEDKLGKSVGSDVSNHKSTYVSLLGKKGAEEKLNDEAVAAKSILNEIERDYDVSNLSEIVDLFANRDH